ncbi:MAG: hypothetical protein GXY76_12985 [Chloroflexi bacterium]|nr:hypothetical protein [Chloroflexota bacterium]
MARLSLALFGGFRASLADQPLVAFESDKVRALLAYLAVEADRPHRREALASLLWPERPESNARQSLSQALSALRRTLGDQAASPPFLLVTPQTLQFNPDSDHWLDVAVYRELLSACQRHKHASVADCDECLERLHEAAALYGGTFLSGFSLPDSAEFEEWVARQRERLHQTLMESLSALADAREQRGAYQHALLYARRALELDPWREEAQQQVMLLLALSGERGAALAQYEACRRVLREELGIEPSVETTQLCERIRRGEVGPPSQAKPLNLPVSLVPLVGRERELAEVAARLREPSCRLLTLLGPGGAGKTRLAIEAATRAALHFPDGVHLVSLSHTTSVEGLISTLSQELGLGDAGREQGQPVESKARLLGYFHGRRMLLILDSFEHLLEGGTLAAQIAQIAPGVKVLATSRARLGVQGEQLYPVGGLALTPQDGGSKTSEVYPVAVQLFLEGARRVRPGYEPPAEDAPHLARIGELVQGLPLALLLASSWMELLSPAEIAANLARDTTYALDFLAADWTDVPERQRSMRSVFDQSWQMLTAREQGILMGLSVFRGGFTADSAEAATGATLRDLLRLADRSLLQRGSMGRYTQHDLVRQYAAAHLARQPDGGAAARDRHAELFVRLVLAAGRELLGPRQVAVLREIAPEADNLHAAWSWAAELLRVDWLEGVADCLEFLHNWWLGRPSAAERLFLLAAERLGAASAAAKAPSRGHLLRLQGSLTSVAGYFGAIQWQLERGRALLEQGLEILEQAEEAGEDVRLARARALQRLARCLSNSINRTEALAVSQQALALAREVGEPFALWQVLPLYGFILMGMGRYDQAREALMEARDIARSLGGPAPLANTLWHLFWIPWGEPCAAGMDEVIHEMRAALADPGRPGGIACGGGLVDDVLFASGRLAECQRLAEEMLGPGEHNSPSGWLFALGRAQVHAGQYEEGMANLEKVNVVKRELGLYNPYRDDTAQLLFRAVLARGDLAAAERWASQALKPNPHSSAHGGGNDAVELALLAAARGRLGEARDHLLFALRAYANAGDLPAAVPYVVPAIALYFARLGQAERAVELYAMAEKHPWVARSVWHEDVMGRPVGEAAAALPPEAVRAAEERGRAREWRSTVEELLAELAAEERPGAEGGAS